MSRLLRPLTFSLSALALAFAGCHTSTPYTRMYSPRKSYYAAPAPKSEKTAEELLIATDGTKSSTVPSGAIPGGPPPADANSVPGFPPPAAPAADPLAAPPAAPAN